MTARSLARPLIAGNWKMHKTLAEASAFIAALLPSLSAEESIDVVLCPTYLALRPMVDWTRGSRVEVYAQNMHYAPEGPFTGEVSAPLDTCRLGEVVIAYEPIWTIGTGRMAALEHTQEVSALVRGVVAERSSEQATRTRVLYGGGV